jgi:hypothetical protein
MNPSEFLSDFFRFSEAAIFVCSLPNEHNGGRPAAVSVCGDWDRSRLDELTLQKWDRPDRGMFFCVNPIVPGQPTRSRDTIAEIVTLHVDIDHDKVDMAPDDILRVLQALELPPSKIVHSGHGFHAYWLFNEALPVSPELITQVEDALRGLARILGGDPACAEIARLLRLPGSLNTKEGGRIPVRVIADSDCRHELGDLAQWIAETRVLIPLKGESAPSNAFLAATAHMPGGNGAAVDVEQRLADMAHKGNGNNSIHSTQLAITAALLNRGVPVSEVVSITLAETKRAAGAAGERWNWAKEERDIRAMCETWQRKKSDPNRRRGVSMEALGVMEFKPIEFLIDGVIPAEGVTLVCSKPKVGKSWLLFDLCLSAAMGRTMLGERAVKQGHTLYLALEDNLRRLRARGEKLLATHFTSWPAGTIVETDWERADQGGIDQIRAWVLGVRASGGNVVCIAVDVLKMIRPAGQENKTIYDRDYESLTGLRSLAHELGVAIVVAHHTRKTDSDDALDLVSGTLGLSGSADTIIVIKQSMTGGYVFDCRGRDLESAQLAAVFDKEACRWRITGEAGEVRRSEAWTAINDALKGTPEALSPGEIADETGLKASTARVALLRMRRDGEVRKIKGKYALIVPSKEGAPE